MGIGEPSFSSSQPLSISSSRWLWVEILDLLNHIFPIKLKLESKKPTEPGNVLTILNFRGGNMGTGNLPSLPDNLSHFPLLGDCGSKFQTYYVFILVLHFYYHHFDSLLSKLGVCMGRVEIFYPTHHGGSKNIQPNLIHHINPTQPTWVGLGWVEPMDWTIFFLLLLLLNWAEKIYHTCQKNIH